MTDDQSRADSTGHVKNALWGFAQTGAAAVLAAMLQRIVPFISNPLPLLLPVIVYGSCRSGVTQGFAGVFVVLAMGVIRLPDPGDLLRSDSAASADLVVWTAVSFSVVLVVEFLRRRTREPNRGAGGQTAPDRPSRERMWVDKAVLSWQTEQQVLFDSVPAMIWFKDRGGRILRANKPAAESIGRCVSEVEGRTTEELYPSQAAKYQGDDTEVIESGRPKLGIIERYEIPGGEERWVRTDKIPYRNEEGRIQGVIVFAVDITEQKQAEEELRAARDELDSRVRERTAELERVNADLRHEISERQRNREALRQSEEQLQAILDYTIAVIYVKDVEGNYVLINRRFEELFHISRDSIIGRSDFEVFPSVVAESFRANDRRVLEAGEPMELEEAVPQDDGMHTYISVKFPIMDVDGCARALCGISTDITERKLVEADLRKAMEDAEQANLAKSRFLANMSHEIRTPIMAMLGAAELIQTGAADSTRLRANGDVILRNGRHLLSLVDDLLDQSRVESGRLDIFEAECSLPDIMGDVYALTSSLRQLRTVEFQVVYETPIPEWIVTDRTRFTQAIVNVVQNALKFTVCGYVRVRIRVESDKDENTLMVAIEDSGSGIAAADIERIFEPFTQVGPVSVGASAGVGLGLPLAKWIVERLGGQLELESEVGRGSWFTFRFPLHAAKSTTWLDEHEAGRRLGTVRQGDVEQVPRLSGSVLLAEDADDVRAVVTEALKNAGAEVLGVANGREAVDAALKRTFDLILLDIRMPEMDGLEVARRLRQVGCGSTLIAMTASISKSGYEQILEAGFDDVWAKPISLGRLVRDAASYLNSTPATSLGDESYSSPVQPDARSPTLSRFEEVQADFRRSIPSRMHRLESALAAGDIQEMREVLHQLVGSAGVFGFMELSNQAAVVSANVKSGEVSGHSPDYIRLRDIAHSIASVPTPSPLGQ